MAGKRISQLAKELGVESKKIVDKCRAEGISDTVVKGHMSTVSAGLEATIKEWFTSGGEGGVATAIETSEKIEPPHEKPRSRSHAKAPVEIASPTEAGVDHGAAKVAHPVVADEGVRVHAPEVAKPAAVVAPPKPVVHEAPKPPPVTAEQVAAKAEMYTPAPVAAPAAPTARPHHAEPKAPAHPPAHKPLPTTLKPTTIAAVAPHAPTTTHVEPPAAPVGDASVTDAGGAAPVAPPEHRGPLGPHARPQAPTVGHKPVMNVPTRPTSVKPMGEQLVTKTPAKLSGPKVVRIEQPEQMEAPRPRRTVGPSSGGSSTGAPRGPRVEGRDDDSSRSPRRRTGPGGPPPTGGPGAKRSTGLGVPDRRRASSGHEWTGGVFSEQDLIEREARLQRAGGFLKKHKQQMKGGQPQPGEVEQTGRVKIAAPFTIKDLSEVTGVKGAEIVKKLFLEGIMATINSGIDPNKAQEIMIDFDIELEVTEARTAEEAIHDEVQTREAVDMRPRGPVVTILGHVDHGKTSLLDKIRNANVAAGEAGGITQRTSAFKVPVVVAGETKEVVFLDTPGHEAFTSMRSRGANMTDVIVLVVSAPEGVMPQTIESINHAKAASVPLIVALNKIDRPDATESQIQKTLRQLADAGLQPQEWGGDTEIVRTSATTGQGIKELLEVLDYQAQLKDLKADFGGAARGAVIEAKQEEGRGAVASVLIQQGELHVGDFVVAGRAFGRVRDITDDKGKRVKASSPPSPVQISGLNVVPDAGDKFYIVDSLRKAEDAAELRRHRERDAELAKPKLTLDTLFTTMKDDVVKEIKIVLKAAEQGTVDVLTKECEKVGTAEVNVRVLHSAIGGIVESDVLLADASKAIIIGFNVIPSGKARTLAEQKGVEIRTYDVIYHITDDLKMAAEGLLAPEIRQEILGHAEVRQVFNVSKIGTIAGCYVTDGVIERNALIRVTRDGVVVQNDRVLEQLKRFKDDAKDVRAGMECGMKIVAYDDIKNGDVLECYKRVEIKRTLGGERAGGKEKGKK